MATSPLRHFRPSFRHELTSRLMSSTLPSSASTKRPSTAQDEAGTKKPKLFAMFAPKGSAPVALWKPCPPSILHYTSPTYAPASPVASSSTSALVPRKVAFFDLDGTLISVRSGAKFPKDAADWKWWNQEVPRKLKKVAGEGDDGHLIVLITNQNGLKTATDKNINKHRTWKTKIEAIAHSLPDVPFQLIAALEKDHYRKPMTGMFDFYAEELKKQGIAVDVKNSYYVGDAAGRPARVGYAKDHGDGDRKWADNLGLKFHTPEMYFGDLPETLPPFDGFRPRDLTPGPLFTPSSSPLIPQPIPPSEIVLFVGSPGAGKTHFFRTFFEAEGYIRVNQDEIGTRSKCLKLVEEIVGKEGKRCVVDNTNRDRATRATYVAIAKKHTIPIRCFHFDLDPALAAHNNLYRLYPTAPGAHVPLIALNSFKAGFEEPSAAEEGFAEVKKIGYVGWTGGEEDGGVEKKRWEGWMS